MLWEEMGTGKTSITLTAISDLLASLYVWGALIVAPRRVAESVWAQEAEDWAHLRHLKVCVLRGRGKDALTRDLLRPYHIHVINYEALPWLADQLDSLFLRRGLFLPWNMIVFDEITRIKRHTGKRIKAFSNALRYFQWRVGLTGTPASNGYLDLFGQYLAVDDGKRLMTSKQAYQDLYFVMNPRTGRHEPCTTCKDIIHSRVADITICRRIEDYISLPPYIYNDIKITLPPKIRDQYEQLEQQMFIQIDEAVKLRVFNASALTMKCRQLANGFLLDADMEGGPGHPVHDLKLEALDEIMEESAGQPILGSYIFVIDKDLIMQRYRGRYKVEYIGPGVSDVQAVDIIKRWNDGAIDLVLGHAQCLHAQTEVLTESRGWVSIKHVLPRERVHDGIEFVSHHGCLCSGWKNTIEVFGLRMTPDHLLWIDGKWEKAQNVEDCRNTRRKARYKYQSINSSFSPMSAVRSYFKDITTTRSSTQPPEKYALSILRWRSVSSPNRNAHLENLGCIKASCQRSFRQKLRWAGHKSVRSLELFQKFLRGHARRILCQFDNRTYRQHGSVFTRELSLGNPVQTTVQQENQSLGDLFRGTHTFSGVLSPNQDVSGENHIVPKPRNDRRRSGKSRPGINLRNRAKFYRKTPVYDLVDCGPRHQFLIRNAEGEIFLSHNSIGHGLNMQFGGHQIVWFGLDWNLDHWLQLNARLRRSGQKNSRVIVHSILAEGTIDYVIRKLLRAKDKNQRDLKAALTTYRESKR